MAEQTAMENFNSVMSAAIRKAARQLRETSLNLAAPCGCTPAVRCDRHCRARITTWRDVHGHLTWEARCNGSRGEFQCGAAFGDLDRVHDWATAHVIDHRRQR